VSAAPDALAALVGRLEQAAARLREDDLQPDEAARLVEQCAALAAEASSELERRSREAGAERPASGDRPA
jgi:ABC-type nitrate/sulfonate/bicarbonate transport system substrate-binding protein